jgi:outer membrane receptor protein involved in Fe transport
VQVRRDWLDPVGLYHTAARQRLSTTREDEVAQTMTGVYAQSETEWARVFRTTLGVRADVYHFSVTSDNPLNSGDGADALVSPKFAAVFGPWAGTEFYANAGMGFHSNDARAPPSPWIR